MDPVSVGLNRNSCLWIREVEFPEPLVVMHHVVMDDRRRQPSAPDESEQFVFQLAVRPFASAVSRLNQAEQNPRASPIAAVAAKLGFETGNVSHALANCLVQDFLQGFRRKRCRQVSECTGHARRRNPLYLHPVPAPETRAMCRNVWTLQLLGGLDVNP